MPEAAFDGTVQVADSPQFPQSTRLTTGVNPHDAVRHARVVQACRPRE
jgi:hypothetical protein